MPVDPDNAYASILDVSVQGEVNQVKESSPYQAMGAPGLKRSGGWIDEEFLPALKGRKAVGVYREMSLNDPTVGSLLFTIEMLLRQVSWTVTSEDNTPESEAAVQFLEECMDDMSHSWSDLIAEILSMLVYGWSWFEVVYKKRVGPWEKDPRKRSKYSDGRIGWRKIEIRAQETLHRWLFDDEGGIQALVQIPAPKYQQRVVPISRSLLFRVGIHKNNPEGVSLLRRAYRPWYMKKRLEEFEAIGVERDLAGLPVAKVPAAFFESTDPKHQKMVKAFKDLVKNVRRDEHEGIVMPMAYDKETKQPLYDFELMSSGGSKQFDTASIINRYETNILSTVLADFIKLGQQGQGSYAMHVDKTGIFRASLNTIAESIAEVFNNHAIPKLFAINGWKMDTLPKITPTNVDPPNLSELSQFMGAMGNLGMQWFPDPDLEKFLRDIAHLPEIPKDQEEMSRMQAMDQNQMNFLNSRMQLAGTHQQAGLVDQGMSPEQAQMYAQAPTGAHLAQEEQAQAQGYDMASQDPSVQNYRQMQSDQQMAESGTPDQLQFQSDIARGDAEHQFNLQQAGAQADYERQQSGAQADHERAMAMERMKAYQADRQNAFTDKQNRFRSREDTRASQRSDRAERFKLMADKQRSRMQNKSQVKKTDDASEVHVLRPIDKKIKRAKRK